MVKVTIQHPLLRERPVHPDVIKAAEDAKSRYRRPVRFWYVCPECGKRAFFKKANVYYDDGTCECGAVTPFTMGGFTVDFDGVQAVLGTAEQTDDLWHGLDVWRAVHKITKRKPRHEDDWGDDETVSLCVKRRLELGFHGNASLMFGRYLGRQGGLLCIGTVSLMSFEQPDFSGLEGYFTEADMKRVWTLD